MRGRAPTGCLRAALWRGEGITDTLSRNRFSSANKRDASRAGARSRESDESAGIALSPGRLRILIVDDHARVREALREMLSIHAELDVVGDAVDGEDAIRQAHALQPDVVVMDVQMPVLDGVAATRRLVAELPQVLVFGLSSHESGGRQPIEDAGAVAYFSKTDGIDRLLDRLLAEHAARLRGA